MKRNIKQDFNTAMDELRFPADAKEDLVQLLMQRQKEQTMYKRYNRKRLFWTVLAAAMVLAMLTGAAAFTRWSKTAQSRFNPSQDIKERAEKSGLSVMLDETRSTGNSNEVLSVTDQGITITAAQTIVDKYNAMIVLRIDGFELPKGESPSLTIFSAEITDIHTVIPPGRFYNGISTDISGKQIYSDGSPIQYDADGSVIPKYTDSNGSLEYYAIFSLSKGNQPVDKDINITITAIGTEGTPSLVQGHWELRWTLSGTADTLRFQPDKIIGKTGVTLLEVEISPISIFTAYKMENTDGHIHNNDPGSNAGRDEAFETIEFLMTGIRMKDGTIHKFGPATGINSMYSDAGVGVDYPNYRDEILTEQAVLLTKSRLIGQIVDPSEIEALIFQNYIPVQKDTVEMNDEDFFILTLS